MAEHFDRSIYVDVNELKMNSYDQMYKFYLSNKVNTETAEYKSRSFKIFIYVNTSVITCDHFENSKRVKTCKILIKLPIHLRYHAPNTSSQQKSNEYTEIILNKPNIFIKNCSAHLNQKDYNENHVQNGKNANNFENN